MIKKYYTILHYLLVHLVTWYLWEQFVRPGWWMLWFRLFIRPLLHEWFETRDTGYWNGRRSSVVMERVIGGMRFSCVMVSSQQARF